MSKQNVRSLTWKYFWQQKWDETKFYILGVGIALACILLPYIIGKIFGTNEDLCIIPNECIMLEYWVLGLGYLMIFLLIVAGIICIFGLICAFIYWIRDNWKIAEARAIRDCRKGK